MKIQEILDSDIPGIMHEVNWGWQGKFKWGDDVFVVELRKTKAPGVLERRVYEASFYRDEIASDDAFSTATGKIADEVPVKVYGVVVNALSNIWQQGNIDAVTFSAEHRHAKDQDQHDRKAELYDSFVRRAWKRSGGYLYVHRAVSPQWLLSREEVDHPFWKNVLTESREELNEMVKNGYIVKSI